MIRVFAAPTSRQDSAVILVHQAFMATTVEAFTCHLRMIHRFNGNDATTSTSVARASHDVEPIRIVSTPREATSALAREDFTEIPHMDVLRYLACVQMAPYAIEMRCVSMLAATDIGE